MADPFRSNSNSQLLREAQLGLSLIAVLLAILVYVAFYRITGRGHQVPEHVRNAPVAQTVSKTEWPDAISPQVAAQEIASNFGQSGVSKSTSSSSEINATDPAANNQDALLRSTVNLSSKTKSDRSSEGFNQSQRSIEKTSSSPVGQTETTQFQSTTPRLSSNRNVPSPRSGDSKPKIAIGKKHNSYPAISNSAVIQSPITISAHKKNSSQNQFSPVGFDKQPQAATDRHSDQSFFPVKAQGKPAVNKVRSNQVSNVKLAQRPDSKNKTDSDPENNFRALASANNGLNLNKFIPAASSKADSKSEIRKTNLMPAPESSVTMPPKTSQSNRLPMNSVMAERANGNNEGSETRETPVGSPGEEPEDDPFPTSEQPILIPSQPLPLLDDMGHAKPLKQARNPVVQTGKTEPVMRKHDPGSFPVEIEPPSQTHIVQPEDSFWSIAEQVYGDGRFFRALYRYNEPNFPDFDSLNAGASLGTPSKTDLIRLFPDDCPGGVVEGISSDTDESSPEETRIYITHEGDTLFDIARQKLGQASRYLEIQKLNPLRLDSQVTHLTPLSGGVRLVLPDESVR